MRVFPGMTTDIDKPVITARLTGMNVYKNVRAISQPKESLEENHSKIMHEIAPVKCVILSYLSSSCFLISVNERFRFFKAMKHLN